MKNIIIGTAGHIDHGKTTLVRSLTGNNTDTLPEEMKRGISINLGFTYFDLPSGKRAGIVDVPGHERFIKNMIAGACGIDIALLIVAATEGVKPQTIEHADIISFLSIKEGLVVLTKCGLADEDMKELAAQDVKERLEGTFFEDKEIVMVDSVSGSGFDKLISKIDELAAKTEERNSKSAPRLNIDRVFTKKGFGAVVTGTLSEGKIGLNDELCIYHYGNDEVSAAKIKNIQVHEENRQIAYAGQRAALNLAGLKASELTRGDVLAAKDSVMRTNIADAQLTASKNTKINLKMWDRLRVYLGSKEIFARFVPLWDQDKEALLPGESCFCQLRFEEDVYVKKDDAFVVRRYSPMETIGGGKILDPLPKKRRKVNENDVASLSVKLQGSDSDVIDGILRKSKEPMTLKSLASLSSQNEKQAEDAVGKLISDDAVVVINNLYLHIDTIEDWRAKLIELVAGFHNKFGLKPGMIKEELRSKAALPLKSKEFDLLISIFCKDKTFKTFENIISLYSFEQKYNDAQQKIYDRIEKTYLDAKYTPPAKADVAKDRASLEVFDSMIKKTLIMLDDVNFLHIIHLDAAKDMIKKHMHQNGSLTIAELRDMTGSSRKYCLLILEYFDNRNFTRRDGEKRVLRASE
ncbi:MAG: selenocysteine-specific translation elongation factor [Defluviitaleaceae bacterium]|nr:selenocysteine-specific translation elongation factor [Defluviitaleaceae bacterium]